MKKTNFIKMMGALSLLVLLSSCSDDDGLDPRGTLEEYLEVNGSEGYTITDSGLYYKNAKDVEGETIAAEDVVNFYSLIYTMDGTLVYDGFSNNNLWKTTISETYANYPKAYTEALARSTVGDSLVLLAPSELAYGASGAGGSVRPNEDLMIIVKVDTLDYTVEDYLEANEIVDAVAGSNGLYYSVEGEGSGNYPTAGQNITVHYRGVNFRGQEFDSSLARDPLTFVFGEGNVIDGWDIGLSYFKKGQSGKLYIPYQLAYQNYLVSAKIGSYENLIFEIEVLDIR